jgi:hypothetical protein
MELGERPRTLHIHAGKGKGVDTQRACGGSSLPWPDELKCMEGTSAYDQAPGGRHSEHVRMTIWASLGLNLDMGQL